MSLMLASVNSLAEARLVHSLKADIIDLKQPARGALGALDCQLVADIVAALKPHAQLSATIGDLPMQAELLVQACRDMAATGVDYVKIGFFPGGDWQACIAGLGNIAQQGHALVAVLFADCRPDFTVISQLARAGFRGVMLDTMHKQQGSLTRHLDHAQLADFVSQAQSQGLLTGLAGSLSVADVPHLQTLRADYLGFRGALCLQSSRTAELDENRIREIRELLRNS